MTPLENPEIIALLLNHGAEKSDGGYETLKTTIGFSHPNIVEFFLSKRNIDINTVCEALITRFMRPQSDKRHDLPVLNTLARHGYNLGSCSPSDTLIRAAIVTDYNGHRVWSNVIFNLN